MDDQIGSFFPGEKKTGDAIIYDKTPGLNQPKPQMERAEPKERMIYDRTFSNALEAPGAKEVRDSAAGAFSKRMAESKKERMGEAASQMIYDKSPDPAESELVLVNKEKSELYSETDPGVERVKRSEAPRFIVGEIQKAAEKGVFLKTVQHYEQFIESVSSEIEPKTLERIRSFFGEAKNIQPDGMKDFLKKVDDFVKTIRYVEY